MAIQMVSIRDFQRHYQKYMKHLPILLTRYEKVIGMVATKEQADVWLAKKEEDNA
jgi:hypothetical protein